MGSNQLLRDPVPTCADGEPLDRVRQHARTTTTLPLLCEPLRTDCSGAGTAYVLNQNVLTEIVAPGLTSDCFFLMLSGILDFFSALIFVFKFCVFVLCIF